MSARVPSESADADVNAVVVTALPTLLRSLLVGRHWQTPRTFRHQFLRAARELGDRNDDPALRTLDVSDRNFHRWLAGGRPRPDACRVLEHLFGIPVDRLMAPADTGRAALAPRTDTSSPSYVDGGAAGTTADLEMPAGPGVWPDSPAVQVTVRPGTAVTVLCQEGKAARVAVVAGPVRVLIETPTHRGTSTVPVADDEFAMPDGARVYSLDAARFHARGAAG